MSIRILSKVTVCFPLVFSTMVSRLAVAAPEFDIRKVFDSGGFLTLKLEDRALRAQYSRNGYTKNKVCDGDGVEFLDIQPRLDTFTMDLAEDNKISLRVVLADLKANLQYYCQSKWTKIWVGFEAEANVDTIDVGMDVVVNTPEEGPFTVQLTPKYVTILGFDARKGTVMGVQIDKLLGKTVDDYIFYKIHHYIEDQQGALVKKAEKAINDHIKNDPMSKANFFAGMH